MRSREKDVLHVHLTQTGRPQTRLSARLPLFTVIFHRAGKLCRLFLLLKFRYCISAKNQLYWQKKDCAAAWPLIRHMQCVRKAGGKYRKYEGGHFSGQQLYIYSEMPGRQLVYRLDQRPGAAYPGTQRRKRRKIYKDQKARNTRLF